MKAYYVVNLSVQNMLGLQCTTLSSKYQLLNEQSH